MVLHETEHDMRARDAAERIAPYRPALSGLAFHLLGSVQDTHAALEDVQSWLFELEPGGGGLGDWLALATGRVCLETLRLRAAGPPRPTWSLPDFVATLNATHDAGQKSLLGGGVGTAPVVALQALSPDERVTLVLHDTYGVPFVDLGSDVLGCSIADVQRLDAHARAAVQDVAIPDPDIGPQHRVVHTFCRLAGRGDHRGLAALLHDGFQLTNDSGDHVMSGTIVDADTVVQRAIMLSRASSRFHPALVNGAAGLVVTRDGHLVAVASFTVLDGVVARIDTLGDQARIVRFDIPGLGAVAAPRAA
jgi:RNA polymerase sigma-70 factor (ECF subfamily)